VQTLSSTTNLSSITMSGSPKLVTLERFYCIEFAMIFIFFKYKIEINNAKHRITIGIGIGIGKAYFILL